MNELVSTSPAVWPLFLVTIFPPILTKALVNQIKARNQKEAVFQLGFFSSPVINWYSELAPPQGKTKKWDHCKGVEMRGQESWITLTRTEISLTSDETATFD